MISYLTSELSSVGQILNFFACARFFADSICFVNNLIFHWEKRLQVSSFP